MRTVAHDLIDDMYGGTCYGNHYSDITVYREELDSAAITDCLLDDVTFDDCSLKGAIASKTELIGVTFRMSDLTELILAGLNLRGVTFVDCKTDGLDLSGSSLIDCNFIRCDGTIIAEDAEFTRTNMYASDLEKSNFINSQFSECMLTHNDLEESTFENASMIEVDFSNSKLEDANLSFSCAHLVNFNGGGDTTGTYKRELKRECKVEPRKPAPKICHNAVLVMG